MCHLPCTCPPCPTHQAHPGGVISLEFERPGHLLATCGADKTVQTWDLNTNGHVTTFHVSVLREGCADWGLLMHGGAVRTWDLVTNGHVDICVTVHVTRPWCAQSCDTLDRQTPSIAVCVVCCCLVRAVTIAHHLQPTCQSTSFNVVLINYCRPC
jgi:WD40 repeat protein